MKSLIVRVVLGLLGVTSSVCVTAGPTTGSDYIGVERVTKYCGVSSLNLCSPLAGADSALLTVEAGGRAFDGVDDPFHAADKAYYALDFDAKANSTLQVVAARGGVITRVKDAGNDAGDTYWPVIRIDHGDGYFTEYAEFSALASGLKVGERVATGAVLGSLTSPNQRSVGADHLHFQVKYDSAYDPAKPSDGSSASSKKSVTELVGVKVGGRLMEDFDLVRTDGVGTNIQLEIPIIEGKGTGIFVKPDPLCGFQSTRCSGVGTNRIRWGTGRFSELLFTPSDYVAEVGQRFEIGRLQFGNGVNFAGSGISSIELLLNTGLTDHIYADYIDLPLRIAIVNTLNTGTDVENADYIYFPDYASFGTFRVMENKSTSVRVYGRFGSLEFDGFGDVADVGVGFIAPLSEPGTGTLAILSLGVMMIIGRARRRAGASCEA